MYEIIQEKTVRKNKINTKLKFISHISKSGNELQSIVEKNIPLLKNY